MQLEAILFDFDGTLFDTIPLIVRVINMCTKNSINVFTRQKR